MNSITSQSHISQSITLSSVYLSINNLETATLQWNGTLIKFLV